MKFLFKLFMIFVIIGMFGSCLGLDDSDSTSSKSGDKSKPTPTPVQTIYDEVYSKRYGGGYSTYYFFDYDTGSGLKVTYYHTHRGKKPTKWGGYDYFTFTGNFDDGLYMKKVGSDYQTLWVWNSKEKGYIAPKDSNGIVHVDNQSRTDLENAITEARKHGVQDRVITDN